MDLQDINGVGPSVEESLNDHGIKNIDDVIDSTKEELSEVNGISSSRAEDIKKKAEESKVIFQTSEDVEEEYNSYNKVSTGIETLDRAIEGGWEQESVVSIYGDSSTGKTQMCMQALAESVRQTGNKAVYIETEKNRYRPQRIKNICEGFENTEYSEINDKIIRVKAHDLELQLSSYNKVIQDLENVCLIVVDSLVKNFRLSEEFEDRSDYGKRGRIMSKHLKAMENMAERKECPVLFTNQVYENPDSGGPYSKIEKIQYGGKKIQYVSQYSIFMEEGAGDTFVCNVESHPSTGNTEISIVINEKGIEEV
jgi:DNA repair protein RadB